MSNAYWRYPEAGNAPAAIAGNPHAAIAGNPHAAITGNPHAAITGKRSRSDYDVSGVHDLPSYLTHADDGGRLQIIRDTESLDASYERYLRNAVSTYGGGQPIRTIDGQVPSHSMEDSHVANIGGVDRRLNGKDRMQGFGSGRPDHSLPPDATNTLFVEGLPSNCSRREVAHIFRPFVGYKEVRLVSKESRQPGGDPLVLCFVDFVSPAHAATAMDALQGYNILQIFFASLNAKRQGQSFNGEWKLPEGYQFDEHDRNSVYLRFQFARHPGARSGGGHRGKR